MHPSVTHLFSIGHSNHTAEHFLQLLQRHDIVCLADVRSAPYSRYNPQFNRESLAALLQQHGIAYLWLGDSLGGKRRVEGNYSYDETFGRGLELLLKTADSHPTAMMCPEEDPRQCHRHHVICRYILSGRHTEQVHISHIRGDGKTEVAGIIITVRQQKLF